MANPTPPCNGCRFRAYAPGSAHSQCTNPHAQAPVVMEAGLLGLLVGQTKYPALPSIDAHGFRNGWAMWPLNFDPIWIDSCGMREGITP